MKEKKNAFLLTKEENKFGGKKEKWIVKKLRYY